MDITTGTRPVVLDRTSEGTSRSGPLVTMTTRVRSGSCRRPGSCSASQKAAQPVQPEERNPSSVRSSLLSTAMARASPVGVTPATAGAAPSDGLDAGVARVTGAAAAGADEGSPTPAPSSCRERRMSAWLRNSPATRMPSSRTTNVETMTSATTPPPFPVGPSIHPRPVHVAALAPRRAGDSSGILRSVPADDLFLPEPEPREVRYTVISVDDHVVEPAHTFENRLPAAWRIAPPASSRRRRGIRCGSSRGSGTRRWG